ncbi:MAG: 1-acyl-sn-glycerol-3-phosphate acyltransferase [Solirubrobacterales bacterium]|nr:1-acyl-sn-glycerol-3-phosphate acyltransferase [Solirubrobacterales bacterium]
MDQALDHSELHRHAREKGINMWLYGLVRLVLVPFFKLYFRQEKVGRDHIPRKGAAIIAANHRSFLDPFIICAITRGRPMYFVAKTELFQKPLQAWILNRLGAFPVDRGQGDEETIKTAKAILARGELVLIFPEGTRIRPGALGKPKRGVGRLALETGAPVIPVAVIGTEAVRKGWRVRPHKVRVRAGRALSFPHVSDASPQLAKHVTDRIWPCVMLQWEWLGGLAPIRRAAVIGAGHWGTSLAVSLAHAGYDVHLGCRTAEQAKQLREDRENPRYLPGVPLPGQINVTTAASMDLYGHDLICLAVPPASLPAVMAAHGHLIPQEAGVLVLSHGRVSGELPSVFVGERSRARALAVAAVTDDATDVTIASRDRGFVRQIAAVYEDIGMSATRRTDVAALESELAAEADAVGAA